MKLNFSDKKQFLAVIRKLAKERKMSPFLLLQEVILDELLDKIAHSEYKNNLVLKGGFLIASLLGTDTRSTRDLDTSVVGLPVTRKDISKIFTDICAIKLPEDMIELKIIKVDDIRKDAEYSGYRIHIKAKVYSSVVDVKVDISTGDVITKHAISYGHKLLLEDRTIEIMAYNVETIIAEKLETIVSRGLLNTRLKDFYDLYLFDHQRDNSIDFKLLRKAIYETAKNRGTEQNISNYSSEIKLLKIDSNLDKMWQAYQARNEFAKNIKFVSACDAALDLVQQANL